MSVECLFSVNPLPAAAAVAAAETEASRASAQGLMDIARHVIGK